MSVWGSPVFWAASSAEPCLNSGILGILISKESLTNGVDCAKTPTEKPKKSSFCTTLNHFGKGSGFSPNSEYRINAFFLLS